VSCVAPLYSQIAFNGPTIAGSTDSASDTLRRAGSGRIDQLQREKISTAC